MTDLQQNSVTLSEEEIRTLKGLLLDDWPSICHILHDAMKLLDQVTQGAYSSLPCAPLATNRVRIPLHVQKPIDYMKHLNLLVSKHDAVN